jgi:two-component system, NarL family, invasion response regulator UvrY
VDSVRVLTVDDHAAFREAARALISATEGFELVGEVATGEEGVAAARRLRPDLVLMDVHLPDIDGYEAARRIEPVDPGAVIVLVSAAEDALQGDIPARCGASAFVRKEDLRPGLIQQLWARHGAADRPHPAAAAE